MAQHWTSYDSAAESHDRLAAPSFFEQPARDLVTRIDVRSAARILDIGTGSGLAAVRAANVADPHAIVVGIDPSLAMLKITRSHGIGNVVEAVTPGLPFANRAFDRALASFVLSHVPSYESAMTDMVRVLRPGGRLGVTTWGSMQIEYREFWQSLAESFIDKQLLAEATREALPWEEWFTDSDHLTDAFQVAGLMDIDVHRVLYTIHTNIADYLAIREASVQARFMRHNLDAPRWERFRQTAAAEFHRRFKDPIDHARDVFMAIGTRP
jgi:ubiquinone/menaquinone biosynthesis C-methylase UbiE